MVIETDSDSTKFKHFFTEFLKTVNENDLKTFAAFNCDESRLNYVYNLPFMKSYNILTNKNVKSSELAKQLKEAGNCAFQVEQYRSALELYSKGIIKQPQSSSSEIEELSILFANRSAALYHIRDYKSCLADIQSALDFNYPANLHYKVYDRKARCLLAQNQLKSAKEIFRKTIQALDDAKLSTERRQKWQHDIQIMLAMLDKNKDLSNANIKTTLEKVKMKEGVNKQYPDASSIITFTEAPRVGRFAEARNEIKPGDLLLREKPHCAVLLDKYSKTHCFHCFLRTQAPYPCPQCSSVVFCSKACLATCMQSHHKIECTIIPALWDSGASITCMMALRIITQHSLEHFLQLKPTLASNTTVKPYKSNDYTRIYNLVNHSSQRSTEDFLHRSVMAVFLLRCLQTTSYFNDESKEGKTTLKPAKGKLTENEKYIGGLILRHLQSLQFNSHEVSELVIKGGGKQSVFIGGAVYPTLALFNHSCNPGIVRYYKGTEVMVRAIRTIRQGEMVAENYGPIFTQVECRERKLILKNQYWFSCECEACIEDWPTLNNMDNNIMRFRCNCGSIVIVPIDTEDFMMKCISCNEHLNIFKGLKVLQDTETMFRVADSLVKENKQVAALHKFIELLTMLDSTLVPPFRDYHLCQQEIRNFMLACGNTHTEK